MAVPLFLLFLYDMLITNYSRGKKKLTSRPGDLLWRLFLSTMFPILLNLFANLLVFFEKTKREIKKENATPLLA